jgi:GNAT superfamily N-acetyltransferase
MKTRKFREEDAKEVCDLIKRNDREVTSKDYPKKVIEMWIKEMDSAHILKKSKGRICYVALVGSEVVGYISFKKNEIMKLFVNPDLHGQGIGKKLIEKIENYSTRSGLRKLTVRSNIGSERFYEKCGFKRIKSVYEISGPNKIKEIYMEKKLK